jgi:hypothetical protein
VGLGSEVKSGGQCSAAELSEWVECNGVKLCRGKAVRAGGG